MIVRCINCMQEFENAAGKCPYCNYEESSYEVAALPPRIVLNHRYILGRIIGSGAFGITYVAWDSVLEKKVAIKEYMPKELTSRAAGRVKMVIRDGSEEQFNRGLESFVGEWIKLKNIDDVNVVKVFDCFKENETAYLVMQFIEGKTLGEIIEEQEKIPFNDALIIFDNVFSALESVHKQGVIHRDIAPDNIMVRSDKSSVLIDFGAARQATTQSSRTLSTVLKIGYAPVEQYSKSSKQDTWTDVYAVAATFYHAITGIRPPASTDREIAKRKLENPSVFCKDLPAHAEIALLNALNVKEVNRTQTIDQFAKELKGEIDVERLKETLKKSDVGKVPLWFKISAVIAAIGIALFGVFFVATGGFSGRNENYDVPVGMSRVPHVLNEFVSDADVVLNDSMLHMIIGDRVTDEYFDNNFVLLQNPRSGSVSYQGSTVSVTASMKPDEYFIPNLINYDREQAVSILEAAGFNVTINEGISDTVAPEAVMSQSPEGNTIVYEGSNVTLVVNKGSVNNNFPATSQLKAPNYVGKQFVDAQADALSNKFYIAISQGEYDNEIPAGQIISQDPRAGDKLYGGGTMYVIVSLGKRTIIVPNLVYLTEEEAVEKIDERLLTATIKYVENTSVEQGRVIAQLPLPGMSIYENGEVTVYVSTGYRVEVPNVVGEKKEDAEQILQSARLGVATETQSSSTVPKGQVISQSVEAGSLVDQGTVVKIIISAGNTKIAVESVSLKDKELTLEYGEIYTLIAIISPKNASTTAVTWKSSNNSVVTVNSAGVITAKGTGSAVITVTTNDGGYTAQCKVTVVKALKDLKVTEIPNKTDYYLNEEGNYDGLVIIATYTDGSTENVTKAADIGKFNASVVGEQKIVCSYSYRGKTLTTSFKLKVRKLKSIVIESEPKNKKYSVNDTGDWSGLEIKAKYTDGSERKVNYSNIDELDSSKPGTKIIQVYYIEGTISVSASFEVRVKGTLEISAPQEMTVAGVYTLTVKDTTAPNTDVNGTWTSKNTSIAKVEGSGNKVTVYPLAVGNVTIVCKDSNGATDEVIIPVYGEWETVYDYVKDENSYEYKDEETWTEYCYQTRTRGQDDTTSTSSTMAGWERYNSSGSWSAWGSWSGWQDAVVYASDSREVSTQTVTNYDSPIYETKYSYKTVYHYFRYSTSEYGKVGSDKSTAAYGRNYYTFDFDYQLTEKGRFGNYLQGYKYWYNGTNYFTVYPCDPLTTQEIASSWQEVVGYNTKTQYRYRDRSWITTYYFYKWEEWSDWSTWSQWSSTAVEAKTVTSGSIPYQTETQTAIDTRKRSKCQRRQKP